MAAEAKCCATCGFMGLKSTQGGLLCEAVKGYRDTGECSYQKYDGAPHCHKQDADLPAETAEASRRLTNGRSGNGNNPASVLEIIASRRTGCHWVRWRSGYSPKEHDQMVTEQLALEAQSRSADALATSSRALSMIAELQNKYMDWTQKQGEWVKQQAEQAEMTNKRLQSLEGKRHWQSVFWNAFSAVAAAMLASWLTWYMTRTP